MQQQNRLFLCMKNAVDEALVIIVWLVPLCVLGTFLKGDKKILVEFPGMNTNIGTSMKTNYIFLFLKSKS